MNDGPGRWASVRSRFPELRAAVAWIFSSWIEPAGSKAGWEQNVGVASANAPAKGTVE